MNTRYLRRLTALALFLVVSMLASTSAVFADDAGYALEFDGVDDVVFSGDTSDAMGPAWATTKTISLWLKPAGPVQGQTADNIGEFIIGTDRPRVFGINRSNLGDGDRLRVWNSDGGPDTVAVEFVPDEWIHIAMVHAGGLLTVYSNGEFAGSIVSGTTFAPRDGNLWIGGGHRTDPASFFGGEIDEVQFWSAALEQSTIQAWMYRELDASHPNWGDLRVYYRMSNGAGTVLTDDSGNAVTGDMRGGMSDASWVTSGAFGGVPDTTPPVANVQVLGTDEDTALAIELTGSDADGDPLSYRVDSDPAHGVLSGTAPNVTYTPNADFNGADNFTFVVNDGFVDSLPATVDITVNPVNDPPVATDDVASLEQDTGVAIDVLANDDDVDGDGLTVTGVGAASHGVAVNNGVDVGYTPNVGYYGADSFTYTVEDGNGGVGTATVNLDVLRVNSAPAANSQVLATDEDMALSLTLTGSDPDIDPLTYRVVSGPSNGVLSGLEPNLTYTPNGDYSGPDSFSFVANDGFVDSAAAQVDITVNAVNDPPLAVDDAAATSIDTPVVVDVLANDIDVDGPSLTVSAVGAASSGAAVHNGGEVTYTPNPGFVGMDSFTYAVDDGTGAGSTGTVTVDVQEASQAGYALRFDGSNDFVRIAETANVFGSGWEGSKSLTMWVKPTGVASVPDRLRRPSATR